MSAILSADDLNDFISPGVACIKPIESLPSQEISENSYEVTTEDKAYSQNKASAQISLTDCLACSGCVTSAEAVLVSLQSHAEVLSILNTYPPLPILQSKARGTNGFNNRYLTPPEDGKVFVASVSPQVRASLAATYNISEQKAGYMLDQFLRGPQGLASGGKYNNGFTWVVDTDVMREVCLYLSADEVTHSLSKSPDSAAPKRPILSSACPGWICYAEKTHPHVLPHLSRLKSPQALTGTLLKSVLSKTLNIHSSQIWHVALMPCFDKKLEASRGELTNESWNIHTNPSVRDVDCVITTRELLTLAAERSTSLHALPLKPLPIIPFPDAAISRFLFPLHRRRPQAQSGPSGGYLQHILTHNQRLNPGSNIVTTRGRNADVLDYSLLSSTNEIIFKCARYYGFRNIQNLVRKLKSPQTASRFPGAVTGSSAKRPSQSKFPSSGGRNAFVSDYAYVEVMACPGGCTNGGGQIRVEDVQQMKLPSHEMSDERGQIQSSTVLPKPGPQEQRAWLAKVDEAYFSTDDEDRANDIDAKDAMCPSISDTLSHWEELTGVHLDKLVYTTYRKVESDVGKDRPEGNQGSERVVELAGKIGGGW